MRGIFLSLLFIGSICTASGQTIAPAPSDKAVVYFARPSGLGALINFTYFDGDNPIGRFNAPKYIRYECEPGKHTFWARSENKSFVEANLEAGKIYFIEAVPVMGALKAAVNLVPVDPNTHNLRPIQRLLSKKASQKFTPSELADLAKKMKEVQERGKAKLDRKKDNEKAIKQLTAEMSVTPEQMVFVKKRKKK